MSPAKKRLEHLREAGKLLKDAQRAFSHARDAMAAAERQVGSCNMAREAVLNPKDKPKWNFG